MHQAQMAAYLTVIYSANIGMEAEEGEIQRRVQQTPAAAAQAANDAEAAMGYCRDEILPELVS
jgi:amphiphysin